jgi:hypothetical protein
LKVLSLHFLGLRNASKIRESAALRLGIEQKTIIKGLSGVGVGGTGGGARTHARPFIKNFRFN